ncbi:MAG: PAS domain S-box protein [Pseudomonadales bacterium]|nr:PAS domain S-box protein [Pseudomonadales bacterium]
MTDGLTDTERALAWAASWHPSFSGIAIVDADFTFRAVNPQFCEIVGATPAEIIGESFMDITPAPIRHLDVKNARLVMAGTIESYILKKTYEFQSGRKVAVVLLVTGVYDEEEAFKFFVSRIMTDEQHKLSASKQVAPYHTQMSLLDLIKNKYPQAIAAGVFVGGVIYGVYKAAGG